MNVKNLMRDNILRLKPYKSARDSYSSGILLDANENSLGSSVEFENVNLNRYPDPKHNELRESISKYHKVKKENIFCGVGSDEIIDLAIRIFCKPSIDNVIVLEPTYGMYKVSADINDIEVKEVLLNDDFQIDVKSTLKATDKNTKIIFLCSPNNPTGQLLKKKDILELCSNSGAIVFIDEAYIEFSENNSLKYEIENFNNLIISRTFSKAWGLAGIRLGYAFACTAIVDAMMNVKAPYNINAATQLLGITAINNFAIKQDMVSQIIKERKWLIGELKKNKKIEKVFQSDANYILFRIANATSIYKKLAEEGVIIRDRSNQIKLDDCLRVSVGTHDENQKFINELNKITNNI